MINQIAPPPNKDTVISNDKPSQVWQAWFNNVSQVLNNNSSLNNDHLTVNPDFHWSRTTGNTPMTSDGEFVEKWSVKGNGMTFSLTPTNYTSTASGSETGSDRYIHAVISAVNTNEFVMYQALPKKLSKYQNKSVSVSVKVRNNTSTTVQAKFYIGFDMSGTGTDSYSVESKVMYLPADDSSLSATLQCPKIDADNQTNIVTVALKLINLSAAVDLNVYCVKSELSDIPTVLHVDHSLEKYKLDNPP